MQTLRVPKIFIIASVVMVSVLVFLVATNIFDIRELGAILKYAEPYRLLLALALQALTYVLISLIWYVAIRTGGARVKIRGLTRLAVEKFAIDQLLHVGGVAGRVAAMEIMQRMGLSATIAIEALIVDTVSYYTAYALLGMVVFVLIVHYHVLFIVPAIVLLFVLAMIVIVVGVYWLLGLRERQPPGWLSRRVLVQRIMAALRQVSPERMRSVEIISAATFLQVAVLFIDCVTLWVILNSLGVHSSLFVAFLSFILASIASLVSLPGGIGSFETANTAALALLGVHFEAAVAATLLLRLFTLWLPLIPGFILAHKDMLSPSEGVLAKSQD